MAGSCTTRRRYEPGHELLTYTQVHRRTRTLAGHQAARLRLALISRMASESTPNPQLQKYELPYDRVEVSNEEFGRGAYAEVRKVKFGGECMNRPVRQRYYGGEVELNKGVALHSGIWTHDIPSCDG